MRTYKARLLNILQEIQQNIQYIPIDTRKYPLQVAQISLLILIKKSERIAHIPPTAVFTQTLICHFYITIQNAVSFTNFTLLFSLFSIKKHHN